MGHIGHEDRLQASGVFCPGGLFFQTLLLFNQVCNITYDAIGAQHISFFIEVWHTVDVVPLEFVAFVEQGADVNEFSPWHIEVVLIVLQTLIEGGVFEVDNQFFKANLALRSTEASVEVASLV